jgi:hypothetical protein
MSLNPRPIPVLDWPDGITEQQQRAHDIVNAITAGTTGVATLAATAAITAAKTAEDAVATRAPGATTTRNTKFALMKNECEKLMDKVYEFTEPMNYDDAAAVLLANGFKVRAQGTFDKQNFEVRNGELTGEVELIAKAHRAPSAHEWAYSTDEGVTWIYITTTTQASRKSDGFTRGTIVRFRHRAILSDGPADYDYDEIVIQ